ncbi:hypothetical protein CTE07_24190 [Chitinophaga terrae (ex Kim and Jung 2007)]|nr:hypothetical protein CTE07_24190 [Chitinophaga terrae (ex Kim and Jung 2007)]
MNTFDVLNPNNTMSIVKQPGFHLAGIKLKGKTTNANGQSAIDCGNLWQEFQQGNYAAKVKEKAGEEVYAVYYDYDSDHTAPYAYFIGSRVNDESAVPEGMEHLFIPEGEYNKLTAQGKMPDCVADKWREIWSSDISRGYKFDFEVYDARSWDWANATVDVFLSI